MDSEFDTSDHRPVIVTMEVTSKSTPTGIKGLNTPSSNTSKMTSIYDASGKRLTQPLKGFNIVKMQDGSVKKFIQK